MNGSYCIKKLALPFCAIVLALGMKPAVAGDTHFQYADAVDFTVAPPRPFVASGGTLTRTRQSVAARLALTGLDADAVYTVWWVIFNDALNCTDQSCGADDVRSVLYATGFVAGADGSANVTAHLADGEPPEDQQVLSPPNPLVVPGGLEPANGLKAEMHMIVRTHGAPIAGATGGQIGTFNGSCDVNVCEDQQAIVFSAPHPH